MWLAYTSVVRHFILMGSDMNLYTIVGSGIGSGGGGRAECALGGLARRDGGT